MPSDLVRQTTPEDPLLRRKRDEAWARRQTTEPSDALMSLLRELYEPDEIKVWLASPQPLFEGATARRMILDGREPELIRALSGLLDGVYI